jgi:hypothetical protein
MRYSPLSLPKTAFAGEAWNLSDRAKENDVQVSKIADQVQALSKNMADSARAQKATTKEQ